MISETIKALSIDHLSGNRWALALGTALVAGVYYLVTKIRAYNRLKAFPGPFSTGLSELFHIYVNLSPVSHLWYKWLCDKYGNTALTSSISVTAH